MSRFPLALSTRLGPDATRALDDVLDADRRQWSDHVLTIAGERFERRLAEESAKLRIEMANLDSNLRQAIAHSHFELLKWMILLWVSQLAAISGILSYMLRK
jgi:hypothetical protein